MRNCAFSLVELLVVLAIVAILSSLAIPAYHTYVAKARVLELLTVAQTYKVKLVEALYDGVAADQEFILDNKTIDRVILRTAAGDPNLHVIEVVAKMQQADTPGIGIKMHGAPLTIQLQARETAEILSWTCNVSEAYNKYVPAECRNNALV